MIYNNNNSFCEDCGRLFEIGPSASASLRARGTLLRLELIMNQAGGPFTCVSCLGMVGIFHTESFKA